VLVSGITCNHVQILWDFDCFGICCHVSRSLCVNLLICYYLMVLWDTNNSSTCGN